MEVLKQAMEYALTHYPSESAQRRAAFANSVAYLVTGWSGGFGGPSIREHLVSWWVHNPASVIFDHWIISHELPLPKPGEWSEGSAMVVAEMFCFHNLPKESSLRVVALEDCYNDDPEDLETIKEWEEEELRQLRKLGGFSSKQPTSQQWNRYRFLKEKLGGPGGHR